jgi:hypothetical protein
MSPLEGAIFFPTSSARLTVTNDSSAPGEDVLELQPVSIDKLQPEGTLEAEGPAWVEFEHAVSASGYGRWQAEVLVRVTGYGVASGQDGLACEIRFDERVLEWDGPAASSLSLLLLDRGASAAGSPRAIVDEKRVEPATGPVGVSTGVLGEVEARGGLARLRFELRGLEPSGASRPRLLMSFSSLTSTSASLRKHYAENPPQPSELADVAWVHYVEGRFQEASKLMAAELAKADAGGLYRSTYRMILGLAEYRLGRWASAARALADAAGDDFPADTRRLFVQSRPRDLVELARRDAERCLLERCPTDAPPTPGLR